MRRCLALLSCISLPAVLWAADHWAVTTSEHAIRQVVVTLSFKGREVERWVFPVGKDAPEVQDRIQHKWIEFPFKPEHVPNKIFTDTWLGSVMDADVYVRFMWWADDQRQGRITSQYVPVPYGSHQTVEVDKSLVIRCSYDQKS